MALVSIPTITLKPSVNAREIFSVKIAKTKRIYAKREIVPLMATAL
jgi:hypothetical protein